jgi:integrase
LTPEEFARLGRALESMPVETWPMAIAATRFLLVTGWRRGEALGLKWSEVDLATRTAHLVDTKTGASMRPLSASACRILETLPRLGPLVFPAVSDPSRLMTGFNRMWLRIAARAQMPPDVTPHVFRHSFASEAADQGFSELTIGALLGHAKGSITSKYVHSADGVLLAAADTVADQIAAQLAGNP